MANRWLLKTEPSAYSFQHLKNDKKTVWDGVKNNRERDLGRGGVGVVEADALKRGAA